MTINYQSVSVIAILLVGAIAFCYRGQHRHGKNASREQQPSGDLKDLLASQQMNLRDRIFNELSSAARDATKRKIVVAKTDNGEVSSVQVSDETGDTAMHPNPCFQVNIHLMGEYGVSIDHGKDRPMTWHDTDERNVVDIIESLRLKTSTLGLSVLS